MVVGLARQAVTTFFIHFLHQFYLMNNCLVPIIKYVCVQICRCSAHRVQRRQSAVYHLTKLTVVNICVSQVLSLMRPYQVPSNITIYSWKYDSKHTKITNLFHIKFPSLKSNFWIYGLILYQVLWHCLITDISFS